ncbi:Protein kinase-like domain [Phytophthora cactorum]|nr:Protein kinase-like domain [Phytophthora cactorum]
MENPFHTRVGTMVRNISNKFNEYEAVVEEHLTKTQTRVKDKLTNNKKSPNGVEPYEASTTHRRSSVGEQFAHTSGRLRDRLSSHEQKISEKAAHLLSKAGVSKMFHSFREELHRDAASTESSNAQRSAAESKGSVGSREPVVGLNVSFDNQSNVTPEWEKSAHSYTEFYTDDSIINKARIPREKVVLQEFISRGAFGKVYKGTYNGQLVAVKTMSDVDTFVKEVKMACTMSHPNIVQFIGVAWNYREDFCCVMEYMDGGDLRGREPSHGFDAAKITIALHVAHALAYLHSRDVPVIHRDLKAKNILLNEALGAKLTDFGVSRERVDRTMTADVGTSLWMAPEVMMGNAYDEKADVFSFGVVLSELSMHSMPYSHTKRPGSSGSCPHWLFSNESRAEC